MHRVALAQDAAYRGFEPLGLELGVTDQAVPSQDSIRGFCPRPVATREDQPAATQLVELEHDTPERTFSAVPGFGLGVTDQAVPSQDSIKVSARDCPPTATQLVGLEQETSSK
jgi:hypothetical protein